MNQPTPTNQNQEPQRLQVASPPSSPHEEAVMTPDSIPKSEAPPADPNAAPAPELTPEEAEMQRIQANADALITPPTADPASAPATPDTPNDDAPQQQYSLEDKVNWLVDVVYNRLVDPQQDGAPTTPAAPPANPNGAPTENIADIYNGAFNENGDDPQQQGVPPNILNEFNELRQELQRTQGAMQNMHNTQVELQKARAAEEQARKDAAEIEKIQKSYNLSGEDASRVYTLMQNDQYGDALIYAKGRSQVDAAANGAREQRAIDREQAGQPSIPGNSMSEPAANQELLEQKLKELNELPHDAPQADRDALSLWLIENGGMELLKAQAKQMGMDSSATPPSNTGVL